MKYITPTILLVFFLSLMGGITACNPEDTEPLPETPVNPDGNNGGEPGNNENMKVQIKIGEVIFTATLQDNATATAFKTLLPMTINMSELHNNEKYFNLSGNLPVAASNPGTIRTGDLMLYGNNCLVLFYKTFSTSYSYTRIGTIDNVSGLEAAVGTGSIIVTFEETQAGL